MKKIFITIIGLCLGIYSQAQNTILSENINQTLTINMQTGEEVIGNSGTVTSTNSPDDSQEEIFPFRWQKTYSKGTMDHGRYAQKAIDNGYVIAGRALISGEMDFDGWIIRTDYQGEVIWEKNYGDYYVDELEVIRTTTDNAYIAIGTSTMFGNSGEGWVIKVDDDGEIIWNKGFHPPLSTNWDYLYDIIELEDGSYVAVGFGNSASTQAWIIKLNNSGEIIWNHEFGDQYWERLTSVKQTSDGGFIAAGDKHIQHGNIVGHDAYLVKFNSLGEIEWEKTYGGEKNEMFRNVNINADGTFTATGSKTNENTGSEEAWVMKTDSQGNEIYNKVINVRNITGITQLEDGNELICANANQKSILVLIDSEGNVLNEQYFSIGNIDDRATSMQITENGHVILGGRANAHTQAGDFWLVTMGEENTMNINDWAKNEVQIYPNPATNYLNIKSDWFINDIKIKDINGKEILTQKVNNEKKSTLNVQALPSGVYLAEIISGNQKQIKKIIVK